MKRKESLDCPTKIIQRKGVVRAASGKRVCFNRKLPSFELARLDAKRSPRPQKPRRKFISMQIRETRFMKVHRTLVFFGGRNYLRRTDGWWESFHMCQLGEFSPAIMDFGKPCGAMANSISIGVEKKNVTLFARKFTHDSRWIYMFVLESVSYNNNSGRKCKAAGFIVVHRMWNNTDIGRIVRR